MLSGFGAGGLSPAKACRSARTTPCRSNGGSTWTPVIRSAHDLFVQNWMTRACCRNHESAAVIGDAAKVVLSNLLSVTEYREVSRISDI